VDAAVTGIEMQNNPSRVAANRTGGAEEAATKIEIRGNQLVPATGAGVLGVEVDQVEDEQLGGRAENAQLRAEIEKLKQQTSAEITQLRAENLQLKQAQPGAVVELGVAAAEAAVEVSAEAATTPEETCPRGWSLDSHEGRTYYHNDHTGETTYDTPTLPAPPAGWRVQLAENAVRYTNAETEEMQWHHPLDAAPTHSRGWSERTEANGCTYYQNEHSGVSTYDKPTLPAPPKGWSVHAHGDEGHHYFQHDSSGGGTQWHHPHDDDPSIVQP
jgi:hypothetical protein